MINLGMSRETFLAQYFEKTFFIQRQALNALPVAWHDLNSALFGWDPRDGLLHLHQGELVPLEKFTETFVDIGLQRLRIVKDVFNAYLRQGATLILNRFDTKSLAVHRLTMELARFVGEKAVANGYVAFGGKGTFARHWDTHDVFAVQLIGRKRWKVFAPTFPLPLPHQKSKEYKHECPPEPVFDGCLEAGDILYIPRGWWHEAIPLENEETFHIAVGIHTVHVTDYLMWACANTLAQQLEFRKTLKFEEDGQAQVQDALAVIHETLLDAENIRAFKAAQVEHERVVSAFAIDQFGQDKPLGLNAGDVLSLNSAYRPQLDWSRISANGFSLKIDDLSAQQIGNLFKEGKAQVEQVMQGIEPARHEKAGKLISELLDRDVIALSQI